MTRVTIAGRCGPLRRACRRLQPDEAARSAALLLAAYSALVVVCGAGLSSLAAFVAAG